MSQNTTNTVTASSSSSITPAIPVHSVLGDTQQWDQSSWHDESHAHDDDADHEYDEGSTDEAAQQNIKSAGVAAAHASAAAARCQFSSFVKESEEIESLLLLIPTVEVSVQRMCEILDEYQEQCELLDPHLPHIITTLMNYVHAIIRPGKSNPVPPANSITGAIKNQTTTTAATPAKAIVATSPTATAAVACSSSELLTRVFKIIYTLAKVRGYKTIIHFFPHEVADLEPTLSLLKQQSKEEYATWETRYGLFLWLSIIVLIPFDLTTVDSTLGKSALSVSSAVATGVPAQMGIISSLISLGENYLSDTGPPREAAAVMLSKLFSRADMHASHLATFFEWCTTQMTRVANEDSTKQSSSNNIFLMTGIFRSLCQIFRHAPRDVLLKHVNLIYKPILLKHEIWAKSTNTLLRKLFVKLSQRVGLTYLPVRVAKWRYQRGHRSLLTTLQQSNEAAAASSNSAATLNPTLGSQHPVAAASPATDEADDEVPSEIEDIIQILLDGLRDRDTIVRWSSAKGIGRITNCLSAEFGDDVVGSVLDLFSGRESDGAWHGGCLALAELARRGLLLPARLSEVVPITCKALIYDQRTATHSVGAHVRDASCYVIWAFARAYAPDVLTKYMHGLAQGLLTICVFDREVNVRRASSAAFQEHVGRQGSAAFPHGMEILQIADYFTVSNRNHAYMHVANEVAKYDEYTLFLITHLIQLKVGHWEKEIRELTAKTLGILTKRNAISQQHMRQVVVQSLLTLIVKSNDLCEKHGALLSVAEILRSLHSMDPINYIDLSLKLQVCDVVNKFTSSPSGVSLTPNQQMLNGRGGQIMRESLCHLVQVIAQIGLLYTNAQTLTYIRPYQTLLDENLGHTNEEVTLAAIRAVEHFIVGYYLPTEKDSPASSAEKLARAKSVLDHYVRTLGHPSSMAGTTRGFAAALGTLPRALLITTSVAAKDVFSTRPNVTVAAASTSSSAATPTPAPAAVIMPPDSAVIYQPLSRILQSLILSCSECAQGDAETRRNAVQSLVRLMHTLTDEDLLQWMTPMPPPPAMPTSSAATPAASSSSSASASAAVSASREKELKAAQQAIKIQQESIHKYYFRDLVELGLPGGRIFERVVTALLIGLDDYATDNRGDVGSWVREACMQGLETITLKLARMHHANPSANIFPPALSEKLFPALLKQSCEKIDRVRERAGQIFHRMLWNGNGIPFIPCQKKLQTIFKAPTEINSVVASATNVRDGAAIDWSSPSQTFPLITPLLALQQQDSAESTATYPYHRAILSGLLISVGGLTESVVKSSSESFISYVSQLSSSISGADADAAHSLTLLKLLASDLLYILQLEKGHARVIVPAFKTLELLLTQNLLEALTLDVSNFGTELQSRVWKEVSKSNNIHKLMASINVLVGLLTYPIPLRMVTFQCLLTLLGHATFPKIRRLTGEALYNCLLISEELIPNYEESPDNVAAILEILTQTPWDGPVSAARIERDKLYALLKVDKPKLKVASKGAAGNNKANATTSSANAGGDISALGTDYSSLVRNIGY